jgi:hypothetical protein
MARIHHARKRFTDADLRIHGLEEHDFDLDHPGSLVTVNPGHPLFATQEMPPPSADSIRQRELNNAALHGETAPLFGGVPDPSDRRPVLGAVPMPAKDERLVAERAKGDEARQEQKREEPIAPLAPREPVPTYDPDPRPGPGFQSFHEDFQD